MDRRVSVLVVSALLAVGIVAVMLLGAWSDLLVAMGHWIPSYLILTVAICTAAWWLRGARYRSILRGLGISAGQLFSTACILISQTANLIVPARLGDIVRVFILKHEHLSGYATGISSVVIERFFDILTVAVLGVLALPFILGIPPWISYIIVVPLAACGAFALVLLAHGRFQTENRFLAIALSMLREMKRASLSLGSLLTLSSLSLVIWLMDVLACLCVVGMFGQRITFPLFPIILLAVVVGNLVKAVPITPGGIGTYEAALAATLALSGMDWATATLIAITDHLIKNGITLIGGILSIRLMGDWVVDAMRSALRGKKDGEAPHGN
jgi:uncharacterized protein (TIRG00374 family)